MDQKTYNAYTAILQGELVPALGCTEPIAIAFAAAKAREALGKMPTKLRVDCSGNIIKNVKGVAVPNSEGMMGIAPAATLGAVGGDGSRGLEVLESITPEHIRQAKALLADGWCDCGLLEGVENLFIKVRAEDGADYALVEIRSQHTHITRIERNGKVLFEQEDLKKTGGLQEAKERLNVKDIIAFADEVDIEDVREVIERQIDMNTAIANEGLAGEWGAQIGRTLLDSYDKGDVRVRAKAMAAAASDARMSGCSLPVVINSGSGNQGATVSLPVIVYAQHLDASREQLIRGLVLSNLIALLQKRYIGSLSAFCGAVCATAGAVSGIIYLHGGRYEQISMAITNTLANVGGIVCDGAKPSCAAKIASSIDAGIMAGVMAGKGIVFRDGQGIVKGDVEQTVASVGRMGREGMRETDVEILNIMLDK